MDWKKYEKWLESQDYVKKTVRGRFNYGKKYANCLLERNFSLLKTFSDSKRAHVLKALSVLSKYLGIYRVFKRLKDDYGLKWTGRSRDDVLIDRLTKVADSGEVYAWIKRVKNVRAELSDFLDFIAITGLRFVETVNAYNLIIKLAREGALEDYYNADKETLEHYQFKDIFIRHTKKAFISFVPKELVKDITQKEKLTRNIIKKRLQRRDIPLRFSDIRETHATFMTKYLKQPEIDFLQGRVSANVFMRNYFNPTLIEDLKERTFQALKQLKQKI